VPTKIGSDVFLTLARGKPEPDLSENLGSVGCPLGPDVVQSSHGMKSPRLSQLDIENQTMGPCLTTGLLAPVCWSGKEQEHPQSALGVMYQGSDIEAVAYRETTLPDGSLPALAVDAPVTDGGGATTIFMGNALMSSNRLPSEVLGFRTTSSPLDRWKRGGQVRGLAQRMTNDPPHPAILELARILARAAVAREFVEQERAHKSSKGSCLRPLRGT
jgi:hypothetical protein